MKEIFWNRGSTISEISFISNLVFNTTVNLNLLNEVYKNILKFFSDLNACYINNDNIIGNDAVKVLWITLWSAKQN